MDKINHRLHYTKKATICVTTSVHFDWQKYYFNVPLYYNKRIYITIFTLMYLNVVSKHASESQTSKQIFNSIQLH